MASKSKKPKSGSKSSAKPKAKAAQPAQAKKVAAKAAKPVAAKSAAPKKPEAKAAPKIIAKPVETTGGLKLENLVPKVGGKAEKGGAKGMTKAAPAVALSKILPKEELAASYELADSEVDDFAEDEKAREEFEEVEEDVEGPPEWWKDDPAAIEGADDEADGDKAEFDDSDEWTEDDEWADDEKKSESTDDVDDDRDW